MQIKSGLVALSVMATLVLFGGSTAEAKSETTDKKDAKKVVVTVKAGDTLSAIAAKHHTSYIRLFNANERINHPDVIDVGDKIRIPSKNEKLKNRLAALPVSTQTAVTSAAAYQSVPTSTARGSSAGNTYTWGTCTWYVKEMRPDLPNNLGNGGQWTANAAAQGMPTGSQAQAGAVGEQPGHVVYVESVSADRRTMSISEMNYNGGVGQVHRRTVSTSGWSFIY